jgi:hypothetical protein
MNGYTLYGEAAYDMFCLCITLSCYFASKYGDQFTRYRFKKNVAAYAEAYDEFCTAYVSG